MVQLLFELAAADVRLRLLEHICEIRAILICFDLTAFCMFQREIANLRRLCSEQGASEDEIRRCKPRRRSEYSSRNFATATTTTSTTTTTVAKVADGVYVHPVYAYVDRGHWG